MQKRPASIAVAFAGAAAATVAAGPLGLPVFFFQKGVQLWMTLHNRRAVIRPPFVRFM